MFLLVGWVDAPPAIVGAVVFLGFRARFDVVRHVDESPEIESRLTSNVSPFGEKF